MFCQFLLYSKGPQSYPDTHAFSHVISHHRLSQETGHGFLCCTAGPHCLSILCVINCTCYPQAPRPSPSLPFPSTTTSLLSMSVSLFLFCRQVHLHHVNNNVLPQVPHEGNGVSGWGLFSPAYLKASEIYKTNNRVLG